MLIHPLIKKINGKGLMLALIMDSEKSAQSLVKIALENGDVAIGDINNDFNLDVLDVVSIVRFILGNSIPTVEEAVISDINEDTNIDVLDYNYSDLTENTISNFYNFPEKFISTFSKFSSVSDIYFAAPAVSIKFTGQIFNFLIFFLH